MMTDTGIITMAITTTMADAALLRLLTWLSPAFPVGAFSYSHGLERAIEEKRVHDRTSLVAWLEDLLAHGSGWNDAVLLAQGFRETQAGDTAGASELAEAMAGSRERHMETMLQGSAFLQALAPWQEENPGETMAYPVAVGAAAAIHGIGVEAALTAYLHAFASNLVQAAVRLVPLGQRDGVAAMAALEATILRTASRAVASSLDDLGSATVLSEVMAMRHETQYSRVFRS